MEGKMNTVILSLVFMASLLHQSEGQDEQDCYNDWDNGERYRGRVSITKSGHKCQNWNAQSPHEHSRTPENYPFAGLEENYCRNPDLDVRPWCYTTTRTRRWEYCDIPLCSDQTTRAETITRPAVAPSTSSAIETSSITKSVTMATTKQSSTTIFVDPTDCYKVEDDGASYRGVIATTVNGWLCQKWAEQSPHQHSRIPDNFPKAGLENNYCRNPDNEESPWCYTTNLRRRWEYCKVPQCAEGTEPSTLAATDVSSDAEIQTAEATTPFVEVEPTELIQTPASTTEKIRPCEANPCHLNASCVDNGDSYSCLCDEDLRGDGITICRLPFPCEETPCHVKAFCLPFGNDFRCMCRQGYEGDGVSCRIENRCRTSPCHRDAICRHKEDGSLSCTCRAGFRGSGFSCRKISPCGMKPCHENATCQDNGQSHSCRCMDGMTGNGIDMCRPLFPCEVTPCHEKADCVPVGDDSRCQCREGYEGNGTTCKKIDPCEGNPCQANAQCILDDRSRNGYQCKCTHLMGIRSDGSTICFGLCGNDLTSLCNKNAKCFVNYESLNKIVYYCKCKDGYTGNGKRCRGRRSWDKNVPSPAHTASTKPGTEIDSCHSVKCPLNTKCVVQDEIHFSCQCTEPYTGIGPSCSVDSRMKCEENVRVHNSWFNPTPRYCKWNPCHYRKPCSEHSTCKNTAVLGSVCLCDVGFIRIRGKCIENPISVISVVPDFF